MNPVLHHAILFSHLWSCNLLDSVCDIFSPKMGTLKRILNPELESLLCWPGHAHTREIRAWTLQNLNDTASHPFVKVLMTVQGCKRKGWSDLKLEILFLTFNFSLIPRGRVLSFPWNAKMHFLFLTYPLSSRSLYSDDYSKNSSHFNNVKLI